MPFLPLQNCAAHVSPWSQRHQRLRRRCLGLWTRLGTKRFRCEEVLFQQLSQYGCIFCEVEVIKGEGTSISFVNL